MFLVNVDIMHTISDIPHDCFTMAETVRHAYRHFHDCLILMSICSHLLFNLYRLSGYIILTLVAAIALDDQKVCGIASS